MVRWTAFAGVVSVLVVLLLALTRSSAALVREGDPAAGVGDSTAAPGADAPGGETDGDDGLLTPLPWLDGDGDEPTDPLSGPGGTERTTLSESDYPSPPPDRGPGDGSPPDETPADGPDPAAEFPISGTGEAVPTEPDDETETPPDAPALGEPGDPARPREPLDRTGSQDRWQGADGDGTDRWQETASTPEDRWAGQPTEPPAASETADTPEGTDAPAADGVTPAGFGAETLADDTAGFDPPLPSERADEELSTGLLLANVVGSQLLFAGLLVAATLWAGVPAGPLGLSPVVTLPGVGLGVVFGVALWAASESGGRIGARFGVDPAETLRGALAPTTRREWWLLLGGVLPVVAAFEEFLFRAVLIGAFAAGFDVPVAVLVVVSSVAFGLAHSAQGPAGIAVSGLLGGVLGVGFVLTGSLAVVVIAHYLVNAVEFVVHEGPVSLLPEA